MISLLASAMVALRHPNLALHLVHAPSRPHGQVAISRYISEACRDSRHADRAGYSSFARIDSWEGA
jgi:hypothetical protein